VAGSTRDRCRSPLQWSAAPNAGFCPPGVAPWLPVNPNYAAGVNVAAQEGDPAALLAFYRRLLRLRRATPALLGGDYGPLLPGSPDVLAFLRVEAARGQTCLVALNFSAEVQQAPLAGAGGPPRLLFSSAPRDAGPLTLDPLALAPFEVVIAEMA
jgi:alpha-glucosidase